MATNQFLPFGVGSGANVLSQSEWDALDARQTGFQAGIARSPQLNKAWRQSAVMTHVLARLIAEDANLPALDDGDLNTLKANLIAAIQALRPRGMQVFAAPGSATWTVPAGVTRARVRVWGAGGSGGSTANVNSAGGGGGGGGYAEAVVSVAPGASRSIVVGAGGAPNNTAAANGNPGGSSTFSGILTGQGGGAGLGANGTQAAGGAGGTASGGALNIPGTGGGFGILYANNGLTGGGIGGGAPFGSGNAGPSVSSTAPATGMPGTYPGGGGNGGSYGGGGGAGAPGLVIIDW